MKVQYPFVLNLFYVKCYHLFELNCLDSETQIRELSWIRHNLCMIRCRWPLKMRNRVAKEVKERKVVPLKAMCQMKVTNGAQTWLFIMHRSQWKVTDWHFTEEQVVSQIFFFNLLSVVVVMRWRLGLHMLYQFHLFTWRPGSKRNN